MIRRLRGLGALLAEWLGDWLGRADVEPSDRKLDNPLTLLQQAVATLAGIAAILSSPAIAQWVPDFNANAALALRVAIAAATLAAAHYVVTAKDAREVVAGVGSRLVRKYRYSRTERLIARGVVTLAVVIWGLSFVAEPAGDCRLQASVAWSAAARPQYLTVTAGGQSARYPVASGRPLALQVPSAHLSTYSVALHWSDGVRSEFGAFSGCSASNDRRSDDGRATISLSVP